MLTYTHTQSVASATWTIDHNLDLRSLVIEVTTPTGSSASTILPSKITKTSDNQVVVLFSSEYEGVAKIHGSSGLYVDYTGFVSPIEREIDYSSNPYVPPLPPLVGNYSIVASSVTIGAQIDAIDSTSTAAYFVGGNYGSGYTPTVIEYNYASKAISLKADAPTNIVGPSAIVGTILYSFSGYPNTNVYRYDITSDSWTTLGGAATIPVALEHSFTATTVGTDIYVFGSTSQVGRLFKFNSITQTSSEVLTVPSDIVYRYCRPVAIGNIIYFLTGTADNGVFAYKYDTSALTWTRLLAVDARVANINDANRGQCFVVKGIPHVYISNKLYSYNLSTNIWTLVATLPVGSTSSYMLTQVHNDKVYAFRSPLAPTGVLEIT